MRTARTFLFLVLFTAASILSFAPLLSVHAQSQLGGGSNSGAGLGGGNGSGSQLGGGNPGCGGGGLTNPLGNTCTLTQLLGAVLTAVVDIGTVVVTIMLVYVGFLFVVAQGNEEKIRDARSALVWTIVGALILLGAKAIQGIISATVGTL